MVASIHFLTLAPVGTFDFLLLVNENNADSSSLFVETLLCRQ